jgi:DNA-binding NarL/FixJ family response regulator
MDKTLSGKTLYSHDSHVTPLTQREAQLVNHVRNGLKNKEIARALGITEGTVKGHLSRLFRKVGARDRFELALVGLKNRPIAQPPPRLAIVARRGGSSA